MAAGALEDRVVRRVGMAGGANAVGVSMSQWEERVIAGGQRCRQPGGGGVAGGAGGRPSRRDVIGVCGSGEVLGVARVAIGWRPGKDIVDVAETASHGGVRAGERERGVVVVEGGPGPIGGGVAGVACCGEAGGRVGGVGGPVPVS